jgi:hypothetical protein
LGGGYFILKAIDKAKTRCEVGVRPTRFRLRCFLSFFYPLLRAVIVLQSVWLLYNPHLPHLKLYKPLKQGDLGGGGWR